MRETVTRFCKITMAFLLIANLSYGQDLKTFYVCSNTSFTLKPQVTTFTDYEWNEVGGPANPIAQTQDLARTAPTITNATYSMTKYTLRVKNGASGCWSDPDTFTVYTLPPVVASINGAATGYCANNSISDTLQTSVAALTLPAGVAANQYSWTMNGNPTGGNTADLIITSGNTPGTTTYAVSVAYSLPAIVGGSKLSTCNGSASVDIIVNTAPTTPAISMY